MNGTKVTCTDLSTGESESKTIENDWIVVCDGDRYLDGVQSYPTSGTVVVTIKRRAVTPLTWNLNLDALERCPGACDRLICNDEHCHAKRRLLAGSFYQHPARDLIVGVSTFYPEHWMTSTDSPVYHITHPDRSAWCGARFGPNAFIGVLRLGTRRCQRCMTLGGEQ